MLRRTYNRQLQVKDIRSCSFALGVLEMVNVLHNFAGENGCSSSNVYFCISLGPFSIALHRDTLTFLLMTDDRVQKLASGG